MIKNSIPFNEEDESVFEEISTITGYTVNVVREVFDFMVVNFCQKLAECGAHACELRIPFLGNIYVDYKNDYIKEDGSLGTEVNAFVSLSEDFKSAVGDIHDEGPCIVTRLLKKKIENSIASSFDV